MDTALLLDFNFEISRKVADALFRHSINVFRMVSAEQCSFEARRLNPAVIIIARSSGSAYDTDKLNVLLKVGKAPVIVISEGHDEAEELAALDAGAAEFIKGTASGELIAARVLHALNSGRVDKRDGRESENRRVLNHDRLELDIGAHNAKWAGHVLNVTCKEMALLATLIQSPGVVKSRRSLIDEAYSEDTYVDDRTVDSHMKRIRNKIRAVDPDFDGIQAVYGIGYRFRVRRECELASGNSAENGRFPGSSHSRASHLPGMRA